MSSVPETSPFYYLISDNGPQFLAGDFKSFDRQSGMTHVRTSPYYPQSNGKLERFHGTLKQECVRPACPRDAPEATAKIAAYVTHYNTRRLHSGIGDITPADRMAGKSKAIHDARDRKLNETRERRKAEAKAARRVALPITLSQRFPLAVFVGEARESDRRSDNRLQRQMRPPTLMTER